VGIVRFDSPHLLFLRKIHIPLYEENFIVYIRKRGKDMMRLNLTGKTLVTLVVVATASTIAAEKLVKANIKLWRENIELKKELDILNDQSTWKVVYAEEI